MFRLVLCVFVISVPLSSILRADALSELDKTVMPLLEAYCTDCHDGSVKKADIDLEALQSPGTARLDIRFWAKVAEQVRLKTMPPPDKKAQPSDNERQTLLAWIRTAEDAVRAQTPSDPGTHRSRRLTRHEYGNTLRDLLGITADLGEQFPNDGAGGEGFDNNADTLFVPALYIEKYIACADKALKEVYARPDLKARLITKPGDAHASIRDFAFRAYRRPLTDDDVKPLLTVFETTQKRGLDFDQAMRVTAKAVLMSPKFLFLQEAIRPDAKQPWRISGYELASRLSYLLWSSLPDAALLDLAKQDKLNDDAVVAQQVKRMLADAKGEAFTRHFAGQWLRLDELFNESDPDRGKFPIFNNSLRRSMYDEALRFSDDLLRRNGRVLDFLDSNYTYANEDLARIYGIPGVQGAELRRVNLPNARRGGVLGMGAILTVTSYPQRTSPVLRGKWVLEQLLGTPAPPPPPSVAQLPEDDRNLKGLTFRQTLEKHRSKTECMGCHVRMDPPGFGLENFNAIGEWRDQENGKPVDSSGQMPDGRKFNGPTELRKLLLEEKGKFVRNFCIRLLGFALGRGLEPADQPALLRLEDTLIKNDWHAEPLIIAVATSYPFTHRR